MARGASLRAHDARARGRADVRVLRWSTHGERTSRHPSRVLAHAEGSVLPAPRREGLLRRTESGMGHARVACRDRSRERAQDQRQTADRSVRRRGIQPPLPRERLQVQGRLGKAQRADRILARLRSRVHHLHQRIHRECVVGADVALRQRVADARPQDSALLPSLWDRAVESRGRAGVRGCGRSERVCGARCDRDRKWEIGNRKWAHFRFPIFDFRSSATYSRVDDDSLDARL